MDKDLKIKGLKVRNFKGIEAIDVEFKDDHTRIIGLNGSGKTSLNDVVQACFMGVSQRGSNGELVGERFRFIGSKGAAADFQIELEDVKGGFTVTVMNHMTKAGNGIRAIASDGRTLDKAWLQEFFNAAFLSADNFLSHTPKEQALLLGIDTSKYDVRIAEIKKAAQTVRADIKAIGDPEDIPKAERVDTNKLREEERRIEAHNAIQEERQEEIDTQNEHIAECESNVRSKERELQEAKEQLKGSKEFLKGMLIPEGTLVITHITDQIENADETNRKAEAYERNEEKRDKKNAAVRELAITQENIGNINADRTGYIKGFKFPLKGLMVDEDGGLLLNDQRLDMFSGGERVIIVANLLASQNPNFKTVLIDEFQSLDKPNQEKIVAGLIDKGFNVVTFEVGDKKKGDGSILLEGCAIVDDNAIAKKEDKRPAAL